MLVCAFEMNRFCIPSRVAVPKPYEGCDDAVDLTWLPQLDRVPMGIGMVPSDGCLHVPDMPIVDFIVDAMATRTALRRVGESARAWW